MPTNDLNFFDLSYISTDDPDGFSDNGGYQFDIGVSTVTIAPGATEQLISVNDDDATFDDDDASQTLNGPYTLNGTSYPDGTAIESEYRIIVRDSLGNDYTLQFVSIGGDAYDIIGFVAVGAMPPTGEALTVVGSSDFPSGTYAYSSSAPACFGPKSRIATVRGNVRACDLQRGDLVVLANGDTARVELVLSSHNDPIVTEGLPIRIRADAFGPGQPRRDLILSPQHRVWLPSLGALVAARALICLPRVGVIKKGKRPDWIHVVLKTHEVLLAEGLACESFWPGPTSMALLPAHARAAVDAIMGDAVPAAPFLSTQDALKALRTSFPDRMAA